MNPLQVTDVNRWDLLRLQDIRVETGKGLYGELTCTTNQRPVRYNKAVKISVLHLGVR